MPPTVRHNRPKLLTWQRRDGVDTCRRRLSQYQVVVRNFVNRHRGNRLRFFVGGERNNI
jgi:hypothetical protein